MSKQNKTKPNQQKKPNRKSGVFTSLSDTKFMFPIVVTDMPIKTCLMEINERKKVL